MSILGLATAETSEQYIIDRGLKEKLVSNIREARLINPENEDVFTIMEELLSKASIKIMVDYAKEVE